MFCCKCERNDSELVACCLAAAGRVRISTSHRSQPAAGPWMLPTAASPLVLCAHDLTAGIFSAPHPCCWSALLKRFGPVCGKVLLFLQLPEPPGKPALGFLAAPCGRGVPPIIPQLYFIRVLSAGWLDEAGGAGGGLRASLQERRTRNQGHLDQQANSALGIFHILHNLWVACSRWNCGQ